MAKPQYQRPHQAARAALAPTVDAGQAHCAEPICLEQRDGRSRWIPPGTPWDLAHNRDTGQYRGPAHRRCNRAEGATHGNRTRNTNRRPRWIL